MEKANEILDTLRSVENASDEEKALALRHAAEWSLERARDGENIELASVDSLQDVCRVLLGLIMFSGNPDDVVLRAAATSDGERLASLLYSAICISISELKDKVSVGDAFEKWLSEHGHS